MRERGGGPTEEERALKAMGWEPRVGETIWWQVERQAADGVGTWLWWKKGIWGRDGVTYDGGYDSFKNPRQAWPRFTL